MTNFVKFLLVFGLLLGSQASIAADADGRFWLGGGAGGVQCPEFVASMEKARSLRIGSIDYVRATQGFTMFLFGFRSGYNVSTPDTCDVFAGEENDYLLLA